jgi:gamma-glutamylcyclotransferase (GGCT)/AIG2-like uncharacterized protein YtfP
LSDNLSTSVNIFSYGTLQDPKVQAQVLNRQVESWPDSLSQYELGVITITDASVLAISQQQQHPIIHYSGKAEDKVKGVVLKITEAELLNFDKYETSDYQRVSVCLDSGVTCFAYVASEQDA